MSHAPTATNIAIAKTITFARFATTRNQASAPDAFYIQRNTNASLLNVPVSFDILEPTVGRLF
jgi:hypothetical protein